MPETAKLELLAFGIALTLQPKLAPGEADEATGYDLALAITEADVAAYWRPTKDNFLSRVSRNQLLALAHNTLGDSWALARASEKKASLVDQLHRAFAEPAKFGRNPDQVEKIKSWLPAGMALKFAPASNPAKKGKAKNAA